MNKISSVALSYEEILKKAQEHPAVTATYTCDNLINFVTGMSKQISDLLHNKAQSAQQTQKPLDQNFYNLYTSWYKNSPLYTYYVLKTNPFKAKSKKDATTPEDFKKALSTTIQSAVYINNYIAQLKAILPGQIDFEELRAVNNPSLLNNLISTYSIVYNTLPGTTVSPVA